MISILPIKDYLIITNCLPPKRFKTDLPHQVHIFETYLHYIFLLLQNTFQ